MGQRGPARDPVALSVLKGGAQAERATTTARVADEPPVAPGYLSPEGLLVWERVMAGVLAARTIKSVDADVLGAYCEAVARHAEAARILRNAGPLVKGRRDGEFVKNPLHQIVRDNVLLMRALARELGLTPAARAGIEIPGDNRDGEGAERFLTG